MMVERAVITHGSPTLARLKRGNLFNITPDWETFDEEFARLNEMFAPKGLFLTVLRKRSGKVLLYLYRKCDLEGALSCPLIQEFLRSCGYTSFRLEDVLGHLRHRLETAEDFPHEIGVFLGYPLSDVIGFIQNGGQNCICCGCWKVYSNECEALRSFERFRKCKEVYGRLFDAGQPLSKLAVRSRAG